MKKAWVHKAKSFEEAERSDAAFWRRAGAAARFEAGWTMVGEFLTMRGNSRAQLRLRRSVQRVRRSRYGNVSINILGLAELIQAKQATGRPQDKLDLAKLRKRRNN